MHNDPDFDSLLPAPRLDRRGFLVTASAAGFALAVHPVSAQTMIHTDDTGLRTGDATIDTGTGALPIYHAAPATGDKLPVVLVVQEIFGVHEHIRDVCRRLAKLGYLAIAPELYFRQGDPGKYDNIPTLLSELVSKVPDEQVMSDLDMSVLWAADQGGDTARLGITGFCWGGRVVWLYAAHNPKLKAGVAWYGRLRGQPSALTPRHPVDLVGELKAPVLGLYGAEDQGIPAADAEAMRDALKAAGKPGEIVIYPDAGHAFHADYRPSYREAAAKDGGQRLQAWFKRYGV
ncbi:dienelactone hydrolase family protein [Denitromonas iodatirespirans]|uniref:Dienelactone hydrolase family protein n=1 Tax=Denitromonas iodatirespirans TaxID=2795389 RepID=A0A944HD26_DENI1|nr:dienelactone hydrolase family protein [Denitromonas iodatirespirans]MBT0963307.1 dienelactone hydrolase family protein [Denitromonas iodatirespirans]